MLLIESKILTARLSQFIYKVSTFKFYDSKTKIGKYYSSELGTKSYSKRIAPYKFRTTKVYDLNKTELFTHETQSRVI